ncbi:hypothetical protein D3C80_1691740 [compost metagenome]
MEVSTGYCIAGFDQQILERHFFLNCCPVNNYVVGLNIAGWKYREGDHNIFMIVVFVKHALKRGKEQNKHRH